LYLITTTVLLKPNLQYLIRMQRVSFNISEHYTDLTKIKPLNLSSTTFGN